eukprot:391295-Rhodomonas_salina.2
MSHMSVWRRSTSFACSAGAELCSCGTLRAGVFLVNTECCGMCGSGKMRLGSTSISSCNAASAAYACSTCSGARAAIGVTMASNGFTGMVDCGVELLSSALALAGACGGVFNVRVAAAGGSRVAVFAYGVVIDRYTLLLAASRYALLLTASRYALLLAASRYALLLAASRTWRNEPPVFGVFAAGGQDYGHFLCVYVPFSGSGFVLSFFRVCGIVSVFVCAVEEHEACHEDGDACGEQRDVVWGEAVQFAVEDSACDEAAEDPEGVEHGDVERGGVYGEACVEDESFDWDAECEGGEQDPCEGWHCVWWRRACDECDDECRACFAEDDAAVCDERREDAVEEADVALFWRRVLLLFCARGVLFDDECCYERDGRGDCCE